MERLDALPEKKQWKSVQRAPFVPEILDRTITSLTVDPKNPLIFCVLEIEIDKESGCSPPLATRWMEILGSPLIPFDPKLRGQLEDRAKRKIKKLLDIKRAMKRKKKVTKAIEESL